MELVLNSNNILMGAISNDKEFFDLYSNKIDVKKIIVSDEDFIPKNSDNYITMNDFIKDKEYNEILDKLIKKSQYHKSNHLGIYENGFDINVKLDNLKIPEKIREYLSNEEINLIVEDQIAFALEDIKIFIDNVDQLLFNDVYLDGRSGGWLVVKTESNLSDFSLIDIKQEIDFENEIDYDEEIGFDNGLDLDFFTEYILTSVIFIETIMPEVYERKTKLENVLSQYDFWQSQIDN